MGKKEKNIFLSKKSELNFTDRERFGLLQKLQEIFSEYYISLITTCDYHHRNDK